MTFKPIMRFLYFIAIASFAITSCTNSSSDLIPVNLRIEYKIDPVVDTEKPRLCWELTSEVRGQVQTAYEILVATSPEMLNADNADIWDSDKVP